MALGGGTWVTQDKVLPGAYINVVSLDRGTPTIGQRGVVAIALDMGKAPKTVIELTKTDFMNRAKELLGVEITDAKCLPLREIFRHAQKVLLYDQPSEGTAKEALDALEGREFNILCEYSGVSETTQAYTARVKTWRQDLGKKCQLVAYNQSKPDYEGVINVTKAPKDSETDYALTAWVAGLEAGTAVNASATNAKYDGELDIECTDTQAELEQAIKDGKFTFHRVYGEVHVLEDINSLTTTSAEKGDDFKFNQTIRVVDQIANDMAKLFNTKYLGKIPNNQAGRLSLWGDIVKHHRALETIQAIENFDPNLVTVLPGANKRAVVVEDVITPINSMEQLYMRIVVQ